MGLKPILRTNYFLQCFDTVGWVIWSEPVPNMTYDEFSGMLNPAQSINHNVDSSSVLPNITSGLAYASCWRNLTDFDLMLDSGVTVA